MKNLFLIALFLFNISFYAQPPGGGRSGGGRQNQNQNDQKEEREIKEFSASEVAGIFYYDIEEVIKKIKVKDESVQNKVKTALKDYNFKVKEIAFLNSVKFNELDIIMKSMKGSRNRKSENNSNNNIVNNGDETNKEESLKEKVNKVIRPVREELKQNEEILNETLKVLLSEKQQKKWLKYQEKKKDSLKPEEKPDRENRQGFRANNGGQRRQ